MRKRPEHVQVDGMIGVVSLMSSWQGILLINVKRPIENRVDTHGNWSWKKTHTYRQRVILCVALLMFVPDWVTSESSKRQRILCWKHEMSWDTAIFGATTNTCDFGWLFSAESSGLLIVTIVIVTIFVVSSPHVITSRNIVMIGYDPYVASCNYFIWFPVVTTVFLWHIPVLLFVKPNLSTQMSISASLQSSW